MKYIKKFENKKIEYSIDEYCRQLHLKNYTINDMDGTVDVDDNIYIDNYRLELIPIQFNIVKGDFYCEENQLTTLKGSPKEVGDTFNCRDNQLTTLEGGPKIVDGSYCCINNQLISLEKLPDRLGESLICFNNPIDVIYKLFGNYKRYKDSLDYNYQSGTNIIKLRFKEACDEAGIEIPESIPGYKYI